MAFTRPWAPGLPGAAMTSVAPADDGPDGASDEEDPPPRRRRLLPAPIWHVGKLLVVALIVEYLVLPQIAGTRKALHLLSQVQPAYIGLGVLLQVLGLGAYAQLTRSVLPEDSDPGLLTVLRIQLTTLSISHCVPAGTAAGSSLGYRLMTLAGGGKADVGFALAVQGIGSAVVLNVILWLALVVSIPVWGFSPLYLTAAVLGLVLFVLFAGMVLLMTRGEHWVGGVIERAARRVPFVDARALRGFFDQLAERVRELGANRRLIAKASVWAALNWLLDAASLYVFVGAFGHWVEPDGLLVSFGLANILAAIPLTPGGLGVIEATLTSTLVGFNTPRGIAILGVVGYRLINFWLPIPLGGLAYLSLQVDPGHTGRPRTVLELEGSGHHDRPSDDEQPLLPAPAVSRRRRGLH